MPNGFCLGCQLGLFEGLPVSFSGFSHQLTNSQETTQDDLLQGQRHLWAGKPRQTPNEGWDPEDASLRTDHFPTDGPAPTAPSAVAIPRLAVDGTVVDCVVADAGLDDPEHSVRSHSRRLRGTQRRSSSSSLSGADSVRPIRTGMGLTH